MDTAVIKELFRIGRIAWIDPGGIILLSKSKERREKTEAQKDQQRFLTMHPNRQTGSAWPRAYLQRTLPTSSANFSGKSLTSMWVLSGKRTALYCVGTCSLYQSASFGENREPGSA